MELYILDATLRRVEVIDRFDSLIWAERYNDLGDFKLELMSSPNMRSLLTENTLLACNLSQRVMVVETIEDKVSSDGKMLLTVSGRSLEAILHSRMVPFSDIEDTPGNICRTMFSIACYYGAPTPQDAIPYLDLPAQEDPGTNGEYPDTISLEFPEKKTLFDGINDLAKAYDLGYALLLDPVTNRLSWHVYSGQNRTSAQTQDPAVIFSANLDNLTNTTELITVQSEKNVAYVYTETTSLEVYAIGHDQTTASGFSRKLLLVDATDYTPTGDTNTDDAELENRALVALAGYRGTQTFDGEVNKNGSYQYGADYYLGDVVEMRTASGFGNYLRVTEQILSSDATGESSYPTLTKILTITPGSWASWNSTIEWAELEDPSEYNIMWAEAP